MEGASVKFRILVAVAALCLSTMDLSRASAQPQSMERMLQEGWKTLQDGVLQRDLGEGRVETYSYGEQGRRWRAQRLARRIASLEREYRAYPSTRLTEIVAALKGEVFKSSASSVSSG